MFVVMIRSPRPTSLCLSRSAPAPRTAGSLPRHELPLTPSPPPDQLEYYPPPPFVVLVLVLVLQRVGTVVSNLSKVPENRMTLLKELVSVAKSLGAVSTHDLQLLGQQLDVAKRDAVARVSHVQASCS